MELKQQLEAIAAANGGLLRPCDVVAAAADPAHPLHDSFEWDNDAAATEHRLMQARTLIRTVRVEVPQTIGATVQAFVSVAADRKNVGGGYRPIEEVIGSEFMLRQLANEIESKVAYWRKQSVALGMLIDFEPAERIAVEVRGKLAPAPATVSVAA